MGPFWLHQSSPLLHHFSLCLASDQLLPCCMPHAAEHLPWTGSISAALQGIGDVFPRRRTSNRHIFCQGCRSHETYGRTRDTGNTGQLLRTLECNNVMGWDYSLFWIFTPLPRRLLWVLNMPPNSSIASFTLSLTWTGSFHIYTNIFNNKSRNINLKIHVLLCWFIYKPIIWNFLITL